jgi:glycosyltransferase involved in cell wall biosynthesis
MVYNEARNLDRLLAALCASREVNLRQIIVVSSGSTDGSVPIACDWAKRDARVEVVSDPHRLGKATAINQFLAKVRDDVEVCVLSGGDLLPEPLALSRLVGAFRSDQVGMAGARPVPSNGTATLVDRAVRLQWDLHHAICMQQPKMGELVAFRADVARLDPETVVDEAWLEAHWLGRGKRLVYVPDAIVYNVGPGTWADFFRQRRRVFSGHSHLKRETGYEVSTYRARTVVSAALRLVLDEPARLPEAVVAAVTEGAARVAGAFDVLRGHKPVVWEVIASTKAPVVARSKPRADEASLGPP